MLSDILYLSISLQVQCIPEGHSPHNYNLSLTMLHAAGEWLCWPCKKFEEGELRAGKSQNDIRAPRWEQGPSKHGSPNKDLAGGGRSVRCHLCPIKRGAFRQTTDGKHWVHQVRHLAGSAHSHYHGNKLFFFFLFFLTCMLSGQREDWHFLYIQVRTFNPAQTSFKSSLSLFTDLLSLGVLNIMYVRLWQQDSVLGLFARLHLTLCIMHHTPECRSAGCGTQRQLC